jgi:hypothetical protein
VTLRCGIDGVVAIASRAWLVVAAATAWGAFLRLYGLYRLPPQAWVDEVWFNLRARELVQTGDFSVFYPTFSGGMHPAVVVLSAGLHVVGLGSLVASRLVSAFAGIATIPLAYLTLNELWRDTTWTSSRRHLTAALTAVVCASLLPSVITSRVGYEPAVVPAVTLFCLWQMRRGRRLDSRTAWMMAGLSLGLAQYVSLNGRFVALAAAALGVLDLLRRPREYRRATLAGLAIAAGVAVMVALPLIVFFVREPQWMFARASHVTAGFADGVVGFAAGNTLKVLASFSFVGDLDPRHNVPGRPMLDLLQSLGFVAGIVWALRSARRSPGGLDLIVWLAVCLLPSIATDRAPHFERMVGAVVPAAALVAAGWVEIWTWADARVARVWPAAIPLAHLGAAGVAISAAAVSYQLFVVYPRTPGLAASMTTFPVELARDLAARAEREAVFVERLADADDVYAFDYLLPGTPVHRLDFRACLPMSDGRDGRTTFLVYPDRDPAAARTLRAAYPGAMLHELRPGEATLMARAFLIEVPAGARAPDLETGAAARFAGGPMLKGLELLPAVRAGERLLFTTYWALGSEPIVTDLSAFAHLERGEGGEHSVAMAGGSPCGGHYPPPQWQRGDVVPMSIVLPVPRDAPPGEYALALGWQERPSLRRLGLLSASHALPRDRARLGTVVVLPAR